MLYNIWIDFSFQPEMKLLLIFLNPTHPQEEKKTKKRKKDESSFT